MNDLRVKSVLSIAGSDPCCGAGIQADIRTITELGLHPASVITCLTAQNTCGVSDVFAISPSIIKSQLTSVLSDLNVCAIKIGMLGNKAVVDVIYNLLLDTKIPIIIDPILASTSGYTCLDSGGVSSLKSLLIPISSLITPNIPEASLLLDCKIDCVEDMKLACRELSKRLGTNVLLKGGHLSNINAIDILYYNDKFYEYENLMIDCKNLHGTGCVLSSAIASYIAKSYQLPDAVFEAKQFLYNHLKAGGTTIGKGKNNPCL